MNKSKQHNIIERSNFEPTKIVDHQLCDIAFKACNFDDTPPLIGLIISNLDGYSLMVIEYGENCESNYAPIKSYLSRDDENLLELIPMYFSSLKAIAGQINIQNLSHFEIYGSNIKVQIYFLLEKFMVIALLNSNTELNSREKTTIIEKIKENLMRYQFEFQNFNATGSRKLLRTLEREGTAWLKKLNKNYMDNYKNKYLRKHDLIEDMMINIKPVICHELEEYLTKLPPDFLNDLSKELINKIQDALFRSI
jgi:hypothetical protein